MRKIVITSVALALIAVFVAPAFAEPGPRKQGRERLIAKFRQMEQRMRHLEDTNARMKQRLERLTSIVKEVPRMKKTVERMKNAFRKMQNKIKQGRKGDIRPGKKHKKKNKKFRKNKKWNRGDSDRDFGFREPRMDRPWRDMDRAPRGPRAPRWKDFDSKGPKKHRRRMRPGQRDQDNPMKKLRVLAARLRKLLSEEGTPRRGKRMHPRRQIEPPMPPNHPPLRGPFRDLDMFRDPLPKGPFGNSPRFREMSWPRGNDSDLPPHLKKQMEKKIRRNIRSNMESLPPDTPRHVRQKMRRKMEKKMRKNMKRNMLKNWKKNRNKSYGVIPMNRTKKKTHYFSYGVTPMERPVKKHRFILSDKPSKGKHYKLIVPGENGVFKIKKLKVFEESIPRVVRKVKTETVRPNYRKMPINKLRRVIRQRANELKRLQNILEKRTSIERIEKRPKRKLRKIKKRPVREFRERRFKVMKVSDWL